MQLHYFCMLLSALVGILLDADRIAVKLSGSQAGARERASSNWRSARSIKNSWFQKSKTLSDSETLYSSGKTESQRRMFDQQMAARALIRALQKLVPVAQAQKETWLHPSLERRIHSLVKQYFNERLVLIELTDDLVAFSSPL